MTDNPSTEARELALWAINDADLYRQHTSYAIRALAKFKRRGVYDGERAITGMMHIARFAAQAYCREYANGAQGRCLPDWHRLFSVADRRQCAEIMLAHYASEIDEAAQA